MAIQERIVAGRQELTVTNAAVVTLAIPAGADAAVMQVRTAAIVVTVDGTTPTTTPTGTVVYPLTPVEITTRQDLENFKCIALTASNATVEVTYEKSYY